MYHPAKKKGETLVCVYLDWGENIRLSGKRLTD